MKDPDFRKCLNTALRLLGSRDHSSVELGRKLSQRGFEASQIERVLVECERLAYLNDRKFCDLIVSQQRRKGYGILRITQVLREKGLCAAHIDAGLRQACCDLNQLSDCCRIMHRKLATLASAEKDGLKQKLFRFLQRRGFPPSTIMRVLDEAIAAYSRSEADKENMSL
jgi:regulatory protein